MATRTRTEGDPLAPHSLSPGELKELLVAERAGAPFLVYRDPDGCLGLFAIGQAPITNIGRRPEMHLSLPWDPEVSGLHAELRCVGEELTIVDDGLSTNGTFVNGRRIGGRHRLRDGDRIRLGQTTLVYNAATAVPVAKTVAAGAQPSLPRLTDAQRRILCALCRPCCNGERFAMPATNSEIAAEVFLSVDTVKMHLRMLFFKFELSELPQNQKRARLVECALQYGLVGPQEV
jgi:hypothetical protein